MLLKSSLSSSSLLRHCWSSQRRLIAPLTSVTHYTICLYNIYICSMTIDKGDQLDARLTLLTLDSRQYNSENSTVNDGNGEPHVMHERTLKVCRHGSASMTWTCLRCNCSSWPFWYIDPSFEQPRTRHSSLERLFVNADKRRRWGNAFWTWDRR